MNKKTQLARYSFNVNGLNIHRKGTYCQIYYKTKTQIYAFYKNLTIIIKSLMYKKQNEGK